MQKRGWQVVLKTGLGYFFVVLASAASADPCIDKPGIDDWTRTYTSGLQVRNKALSEISQCVQVAPETRLHFDNIANLGLTVSGVASGLSPQQRADFIRFNADLLWVLANGGFAPSQHNLAALHNAQPGSITQGAIRQDQSIFIYWTRKAAAQREPRALFNLSMRLSRGLPAIDFAQDQALAYQLLSYLKKINSEQNGALIEMMPTVLQETQKLSAVLGPAQALALEKKEINFAQLAPGGPLPGSVWDSAMNVKESVSLFYNLQTTSGNEAAWAWSQKCYVDALGLRVYSKEHEACVAFDIANTQLTLGVFKRLGENAQKNMPTQYGRDIFLARLFGALMQTGMTTSTAVAQIDQINKKVETATAEVVEKLMKSQR